MGFWSSRRRTKVSPTTGTAAPPRRFPSVSHPPAQTKCRDLLEYETLPPYTHCGREKMRDAEQDAPRKLPRSILLRIAYYLPPGSKTALALVNKRTLKLIRICPMTGSARHTFLQLLNRDLPSLLVYCTICRIIHAPLPGEDKQCRDPYGGHRVNVPAGLERNSYTFLEFNYIHVVMRGYRARQEYSHLLQLQCFKEGRDRVEEALRRGISADFVNIIPGAFDENCFLFMTQKVFPVSAAKGWDYSARNLYELGYFLKYTSRICEHRRWQKEYKFLRPDMTGAVEMTGDSSLKVLAKRISSFAAPLWSLQHATSTSFEPNFNFAAYTDSLDRRLYCAITHPQGSHQPCCDADTPWGVVRSCERCDTDFCFNVVRQNVPGRGNELFWVLTSWKNLGSGVDRNDPVWRAHTTGVSGDGVQFQRSRPPLWVYSRFGRGDGSYGKGVYKPKLREASLAAARAEEYKC